MIPNYEYCLRPTAMNNSYYRICECNRKARELGISYGNYMAMTGDIRYHRPKKKQKPKKLKTKEAREAYIRIRSAQRDAQQRIRDNEEIDVDKLSTSAKQKFEKMKEWDAVCAPLRKIAEENYRRMAEWKD